MLTWPASPGGRSDRSVEPPGGVSRCVLFYWVFSGSGL